MNTALAYALPEPNVWLFRLSFWCIVTLLAAGSIGIYRASQEKFALHRNTADVFLSMPVTLLNWLSLLLLLWIGRQDEDLLSSMKSEAAQVAVVWLGTFAIALVQVKKFNPGITWGNVISAACGRLLLGTLAQIGAVLVLAGCFFTLFGRISGRRSYGGLGSYTDLAVRFFIISLLVSIFQFIWSIVFETDREEVNEKMGWVYGVSNVLLFGLACWGGSVLCEHYEAADSADLLRAVSQKNPAAVRHIVAFNPELTRDKALCAAVDAGNRKTLRAVIRNRHDLTVALDYAEQNGKRSLVNFLK